MIITYLVEVPDELAGPLRTMDASTTNSVRCFQSELLGPSLICRSCVHTSLFAPVALQTRQMHADKHIVSFYSFVHKSK